MLVEFTTGDISRSGKLRVYVWLLATNVSLLADTIVCPGAGDGEGGGDDFVGGKEGLPHAAVRVESDGGEAALPLRERERDGVLVPAARHVEEGRELRERFHLGGRVTLRELLEHHIDLGVQVLPFCIKIYIKACREEEECVESCELLTQGESATTTNPPKNDRSSQYGIRNLSSPEPVQTLPPST